MFAASAFPAAADDDDGHDVSDAEDDFIGIDDDDTLLKKQLRK
jgi:hypothetical protein